MKNIKMGILPISESYSTLEESVHNHLVRTIKQLEKVSTQSICEIAGIINATSENENSIFIFGNGGSAATALHMANDFARMFNSQGKPLKVICLNANMSTFSALANDFGYENVFIQQLQGIIEKGDVVIGISASGNSPNCVSALTLAKECSATTISLLGFEGGKMKQLSDYFIHIPENDYYICENIHLTLSHALTCALKIINSSDNM